MRSSEARWLFLAISLCAAACVLLAVENQNGAAIRIPISDAPVWKPGNCREFIIEADGSVVLFAESVYRWHAGKWRRADDIHPEGAVYDAVQASDGKWFVASLRSQQEAVIYRCDGSNLLQVAVVPGAFSDTATLHLASDGTLWIAAKGAIAGGVMGGKTISGERLSEIMKDNPSILRNASQRTGISAPYRLIPQILSLSIPGRGLWFWSHGDDSARRATEASAMKGFQVYGDGRWRSVSHDGGLLGGAIAMDSDSILYASRYKGMFTLSTVDGSIREVDWKLPENESCVFLHVTPSHQVLAITAAPAPSSQSLRKEDGSFGKLVLFENGRARVLLDGMDFAESKYDKGRPVADTPLGTFIASSGGSLVFVPSDASQARRLDWKFNVPMMNVERMRIQGNLLYLLDRTNGLAVMDWEKLLRMPASLEKNDQWDIHSILAEPAAGLDGSIWWIDADKTPGQLSCWRDGKLTSVPLEDRLSAANIEYLAADTKGGIWLMPKPHAALPVACFNNGKWRTFTGYDSAWSTIALEEKNNPRFGFATAGSFLPVFSGGQAAYRDSVSRRIRCFDGASWLAINYSPANEPASEEPLFFEKGIMTARFGDGYYQFVERQWRPYAGKTAVNYVALPSPSENSGLVSPANFPGDKSRFTISIRDTINLSWMGNPEELYRGAGDLWVRFPTAGTPILSAERLSKVLANGSGDIWFVLQVGPSMKLAHYRERGDAPTLQWGKPPASIVETSKMVFYCRILPNTTGRSLLRYRLDGEGWRQVSMTSSQQEFAVDNLLDGPHKIEVYALNELLRPSQPLYFTFEVKRNYEPEIKDLILQLKNPERREAAARALAAIGKPAIPALTNQLEKADSQQQCWVRAILDEINR
jgi:hypothetical protein